MDPVTQSNATMPNVGAGVTPEPLSTFSFNRLAANSPALLGYTAARPFHVMAPTVAPLQGLNFGREQGGAGREGDPNKPGILSSLAGTAFDMFTGNKPGPSDKMLWNMGGAGGGDALSSLTGQLTPQQLAMLSAIQAGRLGNAGQAVNTFNANIGLY